MSPYRVAAPPLVEPRPPGDWLPTICCLVVALLGAANFIVYMSVFTLEGANRELQGAVDDQKVVVEESGRRTAELSWTSNCGLDLDERAELEAQVERARARQQSSLPLGQ